MAVYDTAADIINTAAVECGLPTASSPFGSVDDTMIQLRTLLTQCGRELQGAYQWQQLLREATISTGASPVSSGEYDLPDDFSYMINQTGWTPNSSGLGLPLGGPFTEQVWSALVATNLASSTIYVSFKVAEGVIRVLPAPAPANIDLTYKYVSQNWVRVNGVAGTLANKVANDDDVVLFESILITKMLAARFKQAKGLDAGASLEQFSSRFAAITGFDAPAQVISLATYTGFPYLSAMNIPQSGFGS